MCLQVCLQLNYRVQHRLSSVSPNTQRSNFWQKIRKTNALKNSPLPPKKTPVSCKGSASPISSKNWLRGLRIKLLIRVKWWSAAHFCPRTCKWLYTFAGVAGACRDLNCRLQREAWRRCFGSMWGVMCNSATWAETAKIVRNYSTEVICKSFVRTQEPKVTPRQFLWCIAYVTAPKTNCQEIRWCCSVIIWDRGCSSSSSWSSSPSSLSSFSSVSSSPSLPSLLVSKLPFSHHGVLSFLSPCLFLVEFSFSIFSSLSGGVGGAIKRDLAKIIQKGYIWLLDEIPNIANMFRHFWMWVQAKQKTQIWPSKQQNMKTLKNQILVATIRVNGMNVFTWTIRFLTVSSKPCLETLPHRILQTPLAGDCLGALWGVKPCLANRVWRHSPAKFSRHHLLDTV